MCVVSMVGDHFNQQWAPYTQQVGLAGGSLIEFLPKHEFEALRREVMQMKELLIKAKLYDEQNNEPKCEKEEKIETLKKMAKLFDISLEEIFK